MTPTALRSATCPDESTASGPPRRRAGIAGSGRPARGGGGRSGAARRGPETAGEERVERDEARSLDRQRHQQERPEQPLIEDHRSRFAVEERADRRRVGAVEGHVDPALHRDEDQHPERREPREQPQHDQRRQQELGVGAGGDDQAPGRRGDGGAVVAVGLHHRGQYLHVGAVGDAEHAEDAVADLGQRAGPVVAEKNGREDQPRREAEEPGLERAFERAEGGGVPARDGGRDGGGGVSAVVHQGSSEAGSGAASRPSRKRAATVSPRSKPGVPAAASAAPPRVAPSASAATKAESAGGAAWTRTSASGRTTSAVSARLMSRPPRRGPVTSAHIETIGWRERTRPSEGCRRGRSAASASGGVAATASGASGAASAAW